MTELSSTVFLMTGAGLGKTDDTTLSMKLAGMFLQLIEENNLLPNTICFYTDGVRLVVEGSPVLPQLTALEQKGVRLIVCSTCLEAFRLTESVQVGIIGGMGDIIEAMLKAEKTIPL